MHDAKKPRGDEKDYKYLVNVNWSSILTCKYLEIFNANKYSCLHAIGFSHATNHPRRVHSIWKDGVLVATLGSIKHPGQVKGLKEEWVLGPTLKDLKVALRSINLCGETYNRYH